MSSVTRNMLGSTATDSESGLSYTEIAAVEGVTSFSEAFDALGVRKGDQNSQNASLFVQSINCEQNSASLTLWNFRINWSTAGFSLPSLSPEVQHCSWNTATTSQRVTTDTDGFRIGRRELFLDPGGAVQTNSTGEPLFDVDAELGLDILVGTAEFSVQLSRTNAELFIATAGPLATADLATAVNDSAFDVQWRSDPLVTYTFQAGTVQYVGTDASESDAGVFDVVHRFRVGRLSLPSGKPVYDQLDNPLSFTSIPIEYGAFPRFTGYQEDGGFAENQEAITRKEIVDVVVFRANRRASFGVLLVD